MTYKQRQEKFARIKEEVLQMRAEGMSIQDIAVARKRSYNTIATLLKKYKSQDDAAK